MNSVIATTEYNSKSKRKPTARLPIDIEYWYILPLLRKEFAKSLKTIGKLRQKEIASIMGISESAVSQYLKGTRATLINEEGEEFPIPEFVYEGISEAIHGILKNKNHLEFLVQMNKLIIKIRAKPTQFLCKVHRLYGKVEEPCRICME